MEHFRRLRQHVLLNFNATGLVAATYSWLQCFNAFTSISNAYYVDMHYNELTTESRYDHMTRLDLFGIPRHV